MKGIIRSNHPRAEALGQELLRRTTPCLEVYMHNRDSDIAGFAHGFTLRLGLFKDNPTVIGVPISSNDPHAYSYLVSFTAVEPKRKPPQAFYAHIGTDQYVIVQRIDYNSHPLPTCQKDFEKCLGYFPDDLALPFVTLREDVREIRSKRPRTALSGELPASFTL